MKRKPAKIDLSAFAKEIGATPATNGYDFTVKTSCGPLHVKANPSELTGGAWIACRFDDVDAAKAHFGVTALGHQLNPYSGKWNFTDGLGKSQAEVNRMVARFKAEVKSILA